MDFERCTRCSICLKKYSSVVSVLDLDENNVKWHTKLQYIIPELEWFHNYVICDCCTKQLEKAWEFKKFVLSLEKDRRDEAIKIDSCPETADDFDIDYFYDGDKEIACDASFKTLFAEPYNNDLQQSREKITLEHSSSNNLIENECFNKIQFTCYDCKINFDTESSLIYHVENAHKEINGELNNILEDCKEDINEFCGDEKSSQYTCENCDKCFLSAEEYKSHNSSSHNLLEQPVSVAPVNKRRGRKPLKKFKCEKCSEEFDYIKLTVEHCVTQHGMDKKVVKPYSCEKCDMRFASSANLDQHRNYHSVNRTHMCSLCGKGFKTKSDLTVHEYTHYNRRNYKCTECDKAFNTNKNLRTHHLVVHTDRNQWKYACTVCEKRFPLKTNYNEHIRRHTGTKDHICHICKKPFISKSELQRHVNMHSNIRAFKCTYCNNEYKERRTYQLHLTKKHGIGNAKITVREKKFVCHICPSQFYDKQKLMRHICSHSGLKPFPCHVCDKKFTDKSYLKHHLKVVHSIVEQSDVYL